MTTENESVVIGAGLAGLVCAKQLHEKGLQCLLLESSCTIGGRIGTDAVDGFQLDHGFQVFLTAYPEAKDLLDYDNLNLCRFEPGALVRYDGRFHRLADPWRRPRHLLATAVSPVATLIDKLRIAGFRRQVTRGELTDLFSQPEQMTIDFLRQRGFSDIIIERFFRPFLGGVFLDPNLQTSSRMCKFVFRMFSLGDAAVPKLGMGGIPQQLARHLPRQMVRTNAAVDSIDGRDVLLSSGERLTAQTVVVATEAPTARRLLGDPYPAVGQSVSCLYFAADEAPVKEPILVLNGDGEGPVNNLCVPSQVSSSYAPPDKSLVSVTVLGRHSDSEALTDRVRTQLTSWFGPVVDTWRHLKSYHIDYALPHQAPPALQRIAKPTNVREGVFVCGDHCDTASINGAMASGRRAANAVLAYCDKK